MTQAYDGFVHLGFSNRNGRTISHKKYQEGNSEYQRIIQMPMVFLTIS